MVCEGMLRARVHSREACQGASNGRGSLETDDVTSGSTRRFWRCRDSRPCSFPLFSSQRAVGLDGMYGLQGE